MHVSYNISFCYAHRVAIASDAPLRQNTELAAAPQIGQKQLKWLPATLPPRIRVVASALPGIRCTTHELMGLHTGGEWRRGYTLEQ